MPAVNFPRSPFYTPKVSRTNITTSYTMSRGGRNYRNVSRGALFPPSSRSLSEVMIANLFRHDGSQAVDYSAAISPLTWYPRDGDLPATAAFPSLSKRLYLDDIVLISGQGELHGGRVGFHDVGAAVTILLVQHLRTDGASRQSFAATSTISPIKPSKWVPTL